MAYKTNGVANATPATPLTSSLIKGSHNLTYQEAKDNEHVKLDVESGSILVFDGRMFHRACAHPSTTPRQMIYLVFHRDWYVDV